MAKKTSGTKPAPRMLAQERQWQAQDDLRTLQRAAEIQGNKTRMTAAQREAKAQLAALSKVAK